MKLKLHLHNLLMHKRGNIYSIAQIELSKSKLYLRIANRLALKLEESNWLVKKGTFGQVIRHVVARVILLTLWSVSVGLFAMKKRSFEKGDLGHDFLFCIF